MKPHLMLLAAAALAACGKAPAPVQEPPFAKTLVVAPSSLATAAAYSGEVRARHETTLAFRVGGKIVERLVDVGAVVKAGQPLARLDPVDLDLQARQSEAQRALAEADARRYRELRAKNFISQSALDARETSLRTAEAQAALARNQSGYAVLRADKAGVIAQVLAEPGQVMAAGQAVFRLAEAGEVEVAVAIPELRLDGLVPGTMAEVGFWASRPLLRGRLRELSPIADPATRTYAARVTLVDAAPGVALGMTATVRFAARGDDLLVVPRTAIFQQGDQPAVWVIGADNAATLRPVTLGAYLDEGAVVHAGLSAGERIVAAGVHKISAGEKLRPVQ
ncbi:MAG TPA: efflux RND transporter periplasmic adaptor subunit [Rhodocyclaceae bacterium]